MITIWRFAADYATINYPKYTVCISISYLGEDLDYDFLGPYRDKSTDEDDSDDDRSVNIGLASSSSDSSREDHCPSIGVDSFDPPQSPVAQDTDDDRSVMYIGLASSSSDSSREDTEVEGHEDSEDEGGVEGEDVCDDDDEGGVEEQVISSLINQLDGCDEGVGSEDEGDWNDFGCFEYHFEIGDEEDCSEEEESVSEDDFLTAASGKKAPPHTNTTNPSGGTPKRSALHSPRCAQLAWLFLPPENKT